MTTRTAIALASLGALIGLAAAPAAQASTKPDAGASPPQLIPVKDWQFLPAPPGSVDQNTGLPPTPSPLAPACDTQSFFFTQGNGYVDHYFSASNYFTDPVNAHQSFCLVWEGSGDVYPAQFEAVRGPGAGDCLTYEGGTHPIRLSGCAKGQADEEWALASAGNGKFQVMINGSLAETTCLFGPNPAGGTWSMVRNCPEGKNEPPVGERIILYNG